MTPTETQAFNQMRDALALLEEVSHCFTREDDLPDNLLPRIDAALAAAKEVQRPTDRDIAGESQCATDEQCAAIEVQPQAQGEALVVAECNLCGDEEDHWQITCYSDTKVAEGSKLHLQPQALGEAARPDILEKLTYHRYERDDMTLDNCLTYLQTGGWHKVRGRTERHMVLQITELLATHLHAGEPTKQQAFNQMRDALENVIAWDSQRRYIVPYVVRDPIHKALAAAKEVQPVSQRQQNEST